MDTDEFIGYLALIALAVSGPLLALWAHHRINRLRQDMMRQVLNVREDAPIDVDRITAGTIAADKIQNMTRLRQGEVIMDPETVTKYGADFLAQINQPIRHPGKHHTQERRADGSVVTAADAASDAHEVQQPIDRAGYPGKDLFGRPVRLCGKDAEHNAHLWFSQRVGWFRCSGESSAETYAVLREEAKRMGLSPEATETFIADQQAMEADEHREPMIPCDNIVQHSQHGYQFFLPRGGSETRWCPGRIDPFEDVVKTKGGTVEYIDPEEPDTEEGPLHDTIREEQAKHQRDVEALAKRHLAEDGAIGPRTEFDIQVGIRMREGRHLHPSNLLGVRLVDQRSIIYGEDGDVTQFRLTDGTLYVCRTNLEMPGGITWERFTDPRL